MYVKRRRITLPDILIRDVGQKTINKIDSQVKQLNMNNKAGSKKISRNRFLKNMLDDGLDIQRDNYQKGQFELLLEHQNELHTTEIKLMIMIVRLLAEGNITDAINYIDSMEGDIDD